MKCPGCGENTIRVNCGDEYQGERPYGGVVTVVNWIERTCDCALTRQQENDIDDHAICDDDEPEFPDGAQVDPDPFIPAYGYDG